MERYKRRHQDDPERYSLADLQLLSDSGPHPNFKTLGSGGFGSIYQGRLTKRTDTRFIPSDLVTYAKENSIFMHDMQSGQAVGYNAPLEVLDPTKTQAERYVEVAVKRLTQYSADQLGELVNEGLRLSNLWGCRNVVTVYGVILSQELDGPCIVMERVPGHNLNNFLQMSPNIDVLNWWKTKIEIFRELVLAVMHCHEKGIYHGDLKGENVLLDEYLVPKLVDFGLSFIRRETSYYRIFAGSLFWVSPEVYDSEGTPSQELTDDPFPSDVYSLGMILVEMFLDGKIPDLVEYDFVFDKLQGSVPVPIEPPIDSNERLKQVVEKVAAIAEDCCTLQEDRISLVQCLEKVEELYSLICDISYNYQGLGPTMKDAGDIAFCHSRQYQEMAMVFRNRFPKTEHWVLMQPSRNMVVDHEGNCLIHHFCRLDFLDGVKYIIDNAKWDFQPSRDVVVMAYICVAEGSLAVLRFLGNQWGHIVSQELDLVHEACTYDNADILGFLVCDMQLDFSTYYEEELLKPIHKLALSGRNELIQVLLDAFVHTGRRWRRSESQQYVDTTVALGDRYRNNNTPLHYAVQGDHAHTVTFLLERGGTLGPKSGGLAALACQHGSAKVVRKLLELGYSFDDDTWLSFRPLEYICSNKDEQLLQLLKGSIKNHKHINGWSSHEDPYPPLHRLCTSGELGMAETLILEMAADVKFVDREGNSLLHVVSQVAGTSEMAQLLMNNGVDLHLENNNGLTALDIATDTQNLDLQSFLLKGGASTGKRAEAQQKALQALISHCSAAGEVVQDTSKALSEQPPLSLLQAVEAGDEEMVSQILSTQSLKTQVTKQDQLDLLKTCCRQGHLAMLKLLHRHGADLFGLRAPDNMRSPLHWAAQYGKVDIVCYLVEKGVAVNSPGFSSVSKFVKLNSTEALHHAADLQSEEMMEILLQAGANANALDRMNYTAMDRAIGYKNKNMVNMLIEHGFDTSLRDKENRTYLRLLADSF